MVSKGFLPAWTDANEIWPAVCQSCVITTFAKPLAMRLMTGTTCSPSLTARLPPGRKQFWTSMTSSADASSGLIDAAQSLFEVVVAMAAVPRPATTRLRSNMLHLPARHNCASKSGLRGRVQQVTSRRAPGSAPPRAYDSARLQSVTHGAEAWKGLRPFLARRAADHA